VPTWKEGDVFRTLTNPATCGIGPYPAVVSDEEWLRAMTRLIKEKGARPVLRAVLENLRAAFPAEPPGNR
jgi:hypothetical protein